MSAVPPSEVDVDVLVVGAGTTGLTLALQARAHGASVLVVERRSELFRPSRAVLVHPRTLEVLAPLGLSEQLLAAGVVAPVGRLHLRRREVAVRLGHFPVAGTPFPFFAIIAQSVVEAALATAVAEREVTVLRGAEFVGYDHHDGALRARVRRADGEQLIRCRYLAGCDGPASTVRLAAGIGWHGRPYREEVVLADVGLDAGLTPGEAHASATPDGIVFAFPLGERAPWRLLYTRRGAHDGAVAGQPGAPVDAAELAQRLRDAGLAGELADVAWSARVPLEHRLATAYRNGSVFLAGDAAHVHSPAGGQGMNLGIQDAANLGWKLALAARRADAGAGVAEALLASYEAERRPVARRVLALTGLLFWGEAGEGSAARLLRTRLVPLAAPLLPLLLRRRRLIAAGFRVLSQLGVRYPRSPLSAEGWPSRRRPRVGERVPDSVVVIDGHKTTIHHLLVAPGLHVLAGRSAAAPSLPGELACPLHWHRLERQPGRDIVVVRPDGYVGFRSGRVDPGLLWAWLVSIGAAAGGGGNGQRRPG